MNAAFLLMAQYGGAATEGKIDLPIEPRKGQRRPTRYMRL